MQKKLRYKKSRGAMRPIRTLFLGNLLAHLLDRKDYQAKHNGTYDDVPQVPSVDPKHDEDEQDKHRSVHHFYHDSSLNRSHICD